MSREKNIFEKFPKKWPKGAFGKPVRGERGNHDLPSGAKGGEKMDLEHHYRHKQHTFDAFCKRTIRNESANAFRQIRVQQDCFVSLSDLPEEGSEALATYDLYPWEYTSFPVDGDVILIKDDRLADALTTLPQRFRDILSDVLVPGAGRPWDWREAEPVPENGQQPQAAGLRAAEKADGR